MFLNRQQAGLVLAQELTKFLEQDTAFDKNHAVVLALPRGGVPVAREIALALDCPLNIICSKKIGAPQQLELAIGAVTSDGLTVMDQMTTDCMNVSTDYIEQGKDYLVKQTKSVEQAWRRAVGLSPSLNVQDKLAIVVDDGVATGMTATAAARSLRNQGVAQLFFATPVASCSAFNRLKQEYDQVIILELPDEFRSVSQFYFDFHQVQDAEVVEALKLASANLIR